jgi:hypothetical protein
MLNVMRRDRHFGGRQADAARVGGESTEVHRHPAFSDLTISQQAQLSYTNPQQLANAPQCVSASPTRARTLRNSRLTDHTLLAPLLHQRVKLGRLPRHHFPTRRLELATTFSRSSY